MKLLDFLPKIISRRFNRGGNSKENMAELVKAYQSFADTEAGQIVLNDLLQVSGVGGDPYEDGNPHGTSRNVGMNRIGLRILSFLGSDIRQYVITEKEYRDEQQEQKTGQATTESTDEPGDKERTATLK